MKNGEKSGQKFVLVDVRRTDFEVWLRFRSSTFVSSMLNHIFTQGGTLEGAINLPAHSFYVTIPTHYAIFKAAGINEVIFWCGKSACLLVTSGGLIEIRLV